MPLPTFDLNSALAGKARHIGVLPWLSVKPVKVRAIAPYGDDGAMAVVATASEHGLQPGDRVYLADIDPVLDGFYEVSEHPDESVRRSAFLVEAEVLERMTGGLLYLPQNFNILHPQHLPMRQEMEQREIEMENLRVIQLIAPEQYQRTMNQVRTQVLGGLDNEALEAQAKRLLLSHGVDNPELASQLGILLAEKQVNDAIGEQDQSDLKPEALAEVERMQLDIHCREIELLCGMPRGHMQVIAGRAGAAKIIRQVHGFIGECIREANKGTEGKPVTKKKRAKNTTPIDSETIETIAVAS